MRKSLLTAFLAVIMIGGLTLVSTLRFDTVQASTKVTGIINSNVTWTKANSPYTLMGPVGVSSGVSLTIEAGATVNLNGYYIEVNGTLIARGADNDKIYFNDGSVIFTPVSNSWNEQTDAGSIIQNAVLTGSLSISVSVKITKNSLNKLDINGGSSVISYNSISSINVKGGSPTISNNDITGEFIMRGGSPIVTANTIHSRPWVRSGTAVISHNKIYDGIHADSSGGPVTIANNEISSKNNFVIVYVAGIHADISNNKIIGNGNNPVGISVLGVLSSASIAQNQIYGCQTGINIEQCNVQISKNAIFNNNIGVNILFREPIPGATGPWADNPSVSVQDNTIAKNSIGIQFAPYVLTSTITMNNIQDNSEYNFKLQQYSEEVTISNNWWGTTDMQAINQTIYDNKYDYKLGTVIFVPFLSAPNPQAPAMTMTIPTPTPTPSPSPSPSPSPPTPPDQNNTQTTPQTELYGIIAILAVVIVALLIVIIGLALRKKR